MAQFIYTMNRVGKVVPPKRIILRDISLSFFPGAKIGVLGLNGSGKSTLLKIMSGVDKDIEGEARAQAGIKVGYLPQEPLLDETSSPSPTWSMFGIRVYALQGINTLISSPRLCHVITLILLST